MATMELDVPPYSPFFREDEEVPITESAHILGVSAKLDEGVSNSNGAHMLLIDDYHLEPCKVGDAISSLWLHMEALLASLGTAHTHLALEYMAPLACASIGAMPAKLDEFKQKLVNHRGLLVLYRRLSMSAVKLRSM
jgi:hypothetical protein